MSARAERAAEAIGDAIALARGNEPDAYLVSVTLPIVEFEALLARCVAAEQALAEITQVVSYEWRLKHHTSELCLRTIEQIIAALAGSGEQPGECVCGETSTRNCPVHSVPVPATCELHGKSHTPGCPGCEAIPYSTPWTWPNEGASA